MAADNQPNYAKIGFFILAGVALAVGTLVYLGGFGSAQHERQADLRVVRVVFASHESLLC